MAPSHTRAVPLLFCMSACAPTAYFFFFFQAEDGIRYRDVTGVQTCALPIWRQARSGCQREGRSCAQALQQQPQQRRVRAQTRTVASAMVISIALVREAQLAGFAAGEEGFSTTGSHLVSSVAGPVSRPARRSRRHLKSMLVLMP